MGAHTQKLIQMLVIVQLGGGDEFAVHMVLRCGGGQGFGRGRYTGLADFGKQLAIVLFAHSGIE